MLWICGESRPLLSALSVPHPKSKEKPSIDQHFGTVLHTPEAATLLRQPCVFSHRPAAPRLSEDGLCHQLLPESASTGEGGSRFHPRNSETPNYRSCPACHDS